MNESKRTEQLNIRVTPEMKQALQEEAAKLDWTATKLAEKILKEWLDGAKEKNGASCSLKINWKEVKRWILKI